MEDPIEKGTWIINKDMVCMPPPDFENTVADKGGVNCLHDFHHSLQASKKSPSQSRPPPGLGKLVEREGRVSTSGGGRILKN